MAKEKANYKVDEEAKKAIGDISKMTDKEQDEVSKLVNFGYEFVNKKARKVAASAKRNKKYYEGKLDDAQYAEFEDICKEKGFFTAKKWAEEQLKK